MSLGVGGVLGRRRPLAACTALAASGRRRLHLYSFLAGPETETLVAGRCVATVTSGYLDPSIATPATDAARSSGEIEWHEVSEQLFVGGLLAAANGLPFWPTLGAVGSDVAAERGVRSVACPYTGRPVLAVAATPLHVAVIHAEAATAAGAVARPRDREFLDDADVTLARAAHRVIVTAERIAEDHELAGGRWTALAPFEVDAVVVVGR
jgi:glutaconate CoA-transferase subunit A